MKLLKLKQTKTRKILKMFIFFSMLLCSFLVFDPSPNFNEIDTKFVSLHKKSNRYSELKPSAVGGVLNLTNGDIVNNTRFSFNDVIPIEGNFTTPAGDPRPNYNVSLYLNGEQLNQYNDTTDSNGNFKIDYLVSDSLNIYSQHKIEVRVLDFNLGSVLYPDHYRIFLNTTSKFDISDWQNTNVPYLTGEFFDVVGNLEYGNNSGIAQKVVRYNWFNDASLINQAFVFTNENGEIAPVLIPETLLERLSLKLNYSNMPYVNYSQWVLPETLKIFSGISCLWDVELTVTEGDEFLIQGTVVSSTNNSFLINNRAIEILYNGASVDQVTTDINGSFSYTYTIPEGSGTNNLQISLVNNAGKTVESSIFSIEVSAGAEGDEETIPPDTDETPPPFLNFFIYFIPIVAGIIVTLAILGYRYLQQREEASRVVELPLGDKLRNLKLLKDSGRLEEALSYLFNAIYMDLINAKYGRNKKASETIRDIAIVSVKELKLPPEKIYPFITNIEKVIYAQPYKITEKEFYKAIDLFSPVYYELTNHKFNLKF